MGLPSAIQNCVSCPPRPLLWRSPIAALEISLPRHLSKRNGVQLLCNRVSFLKTVNRNRLGFCNSTSLSRRAGPEGDFSASGDVGTSSESSNEVKNVERLYSPNSIDRPDENIEEELSYASSIKTVASCVIAAAVFGIGVGLKDGIDKASEFFAGYILEQSLSVDNLFVFVLVFKYFKVPLLYQNRVLSYGIAGAVIFRLSLILLGTAAIQRFESVNLFLAAILLYSSFKLFSNEEDDDDLSENFIVKTCQKFIPVTSNTLPY
ncbi:hypothetical protein SAY86_007992 [Trapa natans]|uniref:Thylakoid membrane protein TERC, chloroplastic n=1 Tax=Trapa natans TaxID=22666 RepID=A0AAN7R2P9_TRANT|nr:hypothetical protein SAY86_007992 [Trapa natans]